MSCCFARRRLSVSATAPVIASRRSVGARESVIRPASTLDRSRIPLISSSRWRPLRRIASRNSRCCPLTGPMPPESRRSENPMMALSGVRSSWLMLARNSLLSRVRPLQLDVLRRQRALAPADLIQHRRAIETDHYLVAQRLEQLEVVLGERPPVAVVEHADGADDDPGGAKRHHRRRAEQDVLTRHPVAAWVGVHVVGDDRRAAGDHRPDQ